MNSNLIDVVEIKKEFDDLICIDENSNLNSKMNWKGSIKINDKREIYVRAQFVLDELSGQSSQTEIMNRMQEEYFDTIQSIESEKFEKGDIYSKLSITKEYRNLIYIKFEPDENDKCSWFVIDEQKVFASDSFVYKMEFDKFDKRKKFYSVMQIHPRLSHLIKHFYIFLIKSNENGDDYIKLKQNFDLPLERKKDLILGVIIPAFEKDKLPPPPICSKLSELNSKILGETLLKKVNQFIEEKKFINRDPRIKDNMIKPNELLVNNNSELSLVTSKQKELPELEMKISQSTSSSQNIDNQIDKVKESDNPIKSSNLNSIHEKNKRHIILISDKNVGQIENKLDEKLNKKSNLNLTESDEKEKISVNQLRKSISNKSEQEVPKEKSKNQNEIEKTLSNSSSRYVDENYRITITNTIGLENKCSSIETTTNRMCLITDKNEKLNVNFSSVLNEINTDYDNYFKSFINENDKIYIDKRTVDDKVYFVFDHLDKMDKKLIQFIKIESDNDNKFQSYYDDLSNRVKNFVNIRDSCLNKNHMDKIFILAYDRSKHFNILTETYKIDPLKMNNAFLIGIIVYCSSRKRKLNELNEIDNAAELEMDHDVDDKNRIERLCNGRKYKHYTQTLTFIGIQTTNFDNNQDFVNKVLEEIKIFNTVIDNIELLNISNGKIKVTFRNFLEIDLIKENRSKYLKNHEIFKHVYITFD